MKSIILSFVFLLSACSVFSQTDNSFEIRGVLPWHNFLSGPSAWNESDYEKYLDDCARQGINFIGFHNYTGGGERYVTYVEPMIKISYRNIVPEAYFDNSMTARWGYLPLQVSQFAYGTGNKFDLPKGATAFGSDCSVLSKNKEEHYQNSQRLMQRVQQMAHQRGIKMAMGFEFGVLPPEYFSLNGFFWSGEANMVPDPTHQSAIALHYAAIDNILETYPGIEYIWLWLNEHSFMGVDAANAVSRGRFGEYYKAHSSLFDGIEDEKSKFVGVWALKYLQLTQEYLKKKAPGVKIILGGWGGGNQLPALMKGLDKGLSPDIIFSCLNPGLGSGSQVNFMAEIAKSRKVWAIPWLEGDHQLWHLQPRVSLMKSQVQLASQQKLNGVLAIHWRTEETKLNMEAFSMFARNPQSPQMTKDIYAQYIKTNYGEKALSLLDDLSRWDTDQLNGGYNLSPEYYVFNTQWGILDENLFAIRKTISEKIDPVLQQTTNQVHQDNLKWLKNTIDFELLLHQVVTMMKPAANLQKIVLEEGYIPSDQEVESAKTALSSALTEQLFTTYAQKVRSRGELGVLSSLNQRLWTTYQELNKFLDGYSSGKAADDTKPPLNYNIFCFYYNWYGNTEKNGKDIHWAHPVMRQGENDTITKGFIPGGDDIATNFFPQLGAYSCTDEATIERHMKMLEQARIGVIVLTWWNVHDFGYQSVPMIMDQAARHNIKVCFHIEPFSGRNAETTRENIKTIIDTYGMHPAFYRKDGKPLFFIYDSYLTPPEEWETLLRPDGNITIRNTPYDAIMIGLWVKKGEEEFFKNSGFDGFYTYFGATGFTYGSTPANWPYLQDWADNNSKIFIPSVAPGYIDTRVRPWNGKTTRDRGNGAYYDQMFEDAINSNVKNIGITSFNEWHEGTQIEPAVPFKTDAFHYMDYQPLDPDYYLTRTSYWIKIWEKKK